MPLAGSLDVKPLLEGVPTVRLDDEALRVEDVDILQVLYEIRLPDLEALVPPALNPTIPPVISFLAYRAKASDFGPFHLVQGRLSARAAVRPRAFLSAAYCDNPDLSDILGRRWGFKVQPAEISMRRFHDRIDCQVRRAAVPLLELSLVDPQPITGHDVQYPPGMHLARVEREDGTSVRIVQVDCEYEFRRADRGQPELRRFDEDAWGRGFRIAEPVSASFAACDVTILPVRYICNPDVPASEGTEFVGS
jgi:hypothetical protein